MSSTGRLGLAYILQPLMPKRAEGKQKITIDEAVQEALKNDQRLVQYYERIKQAQIDVELATAARYPSFSSSISSPIQDVIKDENFETTNIAVNMLVTLFSQQMNETAKYYKIHKQIRTEEHRNFKDVVAYYVKRNYFNLLLVNRQMENQKLLVKELEDVLMPATREAVESGSRDKSALNLIRDRLSIARKDLLSFENSRIKAQEAFNFALDPDNISRVVEPVDILEQDVGYIDEEKASAIGIEERTRIIEYQMRIYEQSVNIARSKIIPRVTASAFYRNTFEADIMKPGKDNSGVGISVNWNWDPKRLSAEKAKARSRMREQRARKEYSDSTIRYQIMTALSDLEQKKKLLTPDAVSTFRQSYDDARDGYLNNQHRVTALEVVESLKNFISMANRNLGDFYNVRISELNLLNAMGLSEEGFRGYAQRSIQK